MPLAFEMESPLPQDVSGFQRHRHTGAVRDDARRIIRYGASCRHRRAIDIPTRFAGRWLDARHLQSSRTVVTDAVGVQLHAHGVRVEIVEIHDYLNDVPSLVGLYRHLAKAPRAPFLCQGLPPLDDLSPYRALIGRAH